MKRIFIVGSLNYDLVINAPYMPVGGETLKGEVSIGGSLWNGKQRYMDNG